MDTMLIVDDNEIDRELIASFFSGEFTIIEAQNGEECFKILQEEKFSIDIILLDNWLPDMSGIDILKERKLNELFANIPVVIVTESNDSIDLIEAFKNGADDYITKPLVREILVARVNNVLIATRKYEEIKQQNQQLAELSELDQMTGLYNKVTTVNKIDRILGNMQGTKNAILVLDMDNFKYVNDSEGHLIGDHAIRRVARILNENFRKEDIIGRVGGDEFVIFLSDLPNKEIARRKARDIIRIFKVKKSTVIKSKTTVSIGLAFSDTTTTDYKSIFDKADKALTEAKKFGKACYHEYGVDACDTKKNEKANILVYSKSRTICHIIDKAINFYFNIVEITSVKELEERIVGNYNISIIIADISEDEDDGKQIMEYMQKNTETSIIPRIAICKESNIEQCKIAIQSGIVDLMISPIYVDNVRRRVAKIVKDI